MSVRLKNITYLVTKDFKELAGMGRHDFSNLPKNETFKVVEYHIETKRPLNAKGEPYNSNKTSKLHITIDAGSLDSSVKLYDALSSRALTSYTLLFCQRTHEGETRLCSAVTIDGFATDIKEDYSFVNDEAILNLDLDMLVKTYRFIQDGRSVTINSK